MTSRFGRKYLRLQRLAGGLLNSVKIRSSVPPVPMIGRRTAEWSHEGVFVTTLSPFPETSSQTFERRVWGVCAETRPWPTLFSKPLSPKIGRRTVAKVCRCYDVSLADLPTPVWPKIGRQTAVWRQNSVADTAVSDNRLS